MWLELIFYVDGVLCLSQVYIVEIVERACKLPGSCQVIVKYGVIAWLYNLISSYAATTTTQSQYVLPV